MTTNLYDTDKRKLLSTISHGSLFFSPFVISVGVPIALLFISDDPIVKENAKEAINFHFNAWVYAGIAGFIGFFWFTIILLPLIWIMGAFVLFFTWVLPIFAILSCLSQTETSYRYPFLFRLI